MSLDADTPTPMDTPYAPYAPVDESAAPSAPAQQTPATVAPQAPEPEPVLWYPPAAPTAEPVTPSSGQPAAPQDGTAYAPHPQYAPDATYAAHQPYAPAAPYAAHPPYAQAPAYPQAPPYAPYPPAQAWAPPIYQPPYVAPPTPQERQERRKATRMQLLQVTVAGVHLIALLAVALALRAHTPLVTTPPAATASSASTAGSGPSVTRVEELWSPSALRAQRASLDSQIGGGKVDGFAINPDGTEEAAVTHGRTIVTFESSSPAGTWDIKGSGPAAPYFSLDDIHMTAPRAIVSQGIARRLPVQALVGLKYTEMPAGSGHFGWAASWEGHGLPAPVTLFANPTGTTVSTSAAAVASP